MRFAPAKGAVPLTVAALMGAAGCTQVERIDEVGAGGDRVIPTAVQQIFDANCSLAGCHDSASQAGSLVLASPQSRGIIGGQSQQSMLPLVEIGNVGGSYLAAKIVEEPAAPIQGDPMPPAGPLEPLDGAVLLGWIAGAELPGGGGGDDAELDDGVADAGETGGGALPCDFPEIAPGQASPVVAGDEPGLIPTIIGDALTRNCGCHYSAMLAPGVPGYIGDVVFTTLDEFLADYNGPNPNYMGGPVAAAVLDRVMMTGGLVMPPAYCALPDGTTILADDQMLLLAWLEAGAPDGATFGMMGM